MMGAKFRVAFGQLATGLTDLGCVGHSISELGTGLNIKRLPPHTQPSLVPAWSPNV